ncbi:homoserine O-acetyltransferase [Ilyomonas limi]|uniref:Homoserine O-acetyltransferase n=1 Tax=Ilyomonas limi TaxID=2575867 RepID=A0A4U3LCZ3_9BACT|nr:homoserine O-acetyltransferase [Ilyomonas limi]TKK71777.1 homoserine O-acetyltransferase [Ilyomonas limi]
MERQIFKYNQPFELESGETLPELHLAYTTFGKMNKDKSNVVWIFHALTANSNPVEWWPGLVGEGTFFNPERFFIVCVNMPGSCYGSTGPLEVNPTTGKRYYHHFPLFTTRDMVRAYKPLKEYLGIDKIHIGIGGSMGGQQLLEWAIAEPELFEHIVPIATNAQHSPWGIAFNSSQRWCIHNDATWKNEAPDAGIGGMKIARSIALLSYRHYETYAASQQGYTSDTELLPVDKQVSKAETYQYYQGEKLAKRFNAFSYHFLSLGMDKHNVGRGRTSVQMALSHIKAKTLVIGISSDILFPPAEQETIAAYVPNAQLVIIDSYYGHDGFLLEYESITQHLESFIGSGKPPIPKGGKEMKPPSPKEELSAV